VLTSAFRPGLPSHDEATALVVMALALAWQWRMRDRSLEDAASRWSEGMRGMVAAACLVGVFMTSGGDSRAFIYFQF
jgi:hypothetical protein